MMVVVRLHLLLQFLFFGITLCWSPSRCPNNCICSMIADFLTVDCSSLDLKQFPEPETIPTDAQFINLSHNSIINITLDSKVWFPFLRRIDLSYNRLTKVPTLDGFNNLKQINLSYNRISSLAANLFQDSDLLEELSLENNEISVISDSSFRMLRSLTCLNLAFNHLSTIPVLHNSVQLVDLNLEGNFLTQVPAKSFTAPSLKKLNLKNNFISWIDPEALTASRQLKVLNLANNLLTSVPQAALGMIAESIRLLDLSSNNISFLKFGDFHHMSEIELINLSDNELNFINENIFVDLPQLTSLWLNDNKELFFIDHRAFYNLPSLTSLKLHNANLFELFDIPSLITSLRKLTVYGNPLKCDCSIYWLRNAIRKGIVNDGFRALPICEGLKSSRMNILRALDLMHCDTQSNPFASPLPRSQNTIQVSNSLDTKQRTNVNRKDVEKITQNSLNSVDLFNFSFSSIINEWLKSLNKKVNLSPSDTIGETAVLPTETSVTITDFDILGTQTICFSNRLSKTALCRVFGLSPILILIFCSLCIVFIFVLFCIARKCFKSRSKRCEDVIRLL